MISERRLQFDTPGERLPSGIVEIAVAQTRRHVLHSAMLLPGVASIQTGAGFGPTGRHSGDAGVARGTE